MKSFFNRVVLALVILGLAAHKAEAFLIPPQANVVLISGLAGDLETEKEYQDQLNSWLALLASQEISGKVFVLADAEVQNAAGNLSLIKRKSNREEFAGLKKDLAALTNTTLFIVWGHGGMQGQTPVFHVRGPRLTLADFKSLADSSKNSSSWILFFRGSGTFARELAGPERRILSSEQEAMYSSDPVGMSILLKQLTANPALSFESSAEALGLGVARWYEDRHLARTEEPTLRVGIENPRLLVIAESAGMSASSGASTNQAASLTVSTNLPPAWKGVERIDPKTFPDADAVTLSLIISYTLGNRPALMTEREEFIQILTEEGKRCGDFDFHFSPPGEDIRFIACEVLKPNGELIRLDPEAIREASSSALPDYSMGRRKMFSLPQVSPGAILHVHYQTLWQSFPLPHISSRIPLASEIPIIKQTVRVGVPKGEAFHFSFENTEARDPELKQTEYGATYSWRVDNVAPCQTEAMSPSGNEPQLLISTFPDWGSFAAWYARICSLSDEITPEITSKAAEVTRGASTDQERIVAIYNYVTGLRYVAVEMGINSFRPHAAANVLQNQFGDCKDKANLFNTLLRSLKIKDLSAHLVLVPRFTQAAELMPGLSFNHAISQVTLGDTTLWVDTTDDVCRFGMLPPGDPGRKVLVIDGKSTSLVQLPVPRPQDHRITCNTRVSWADKQEMRLRSEITTLGYADYELRELARHARRHSANLPLLSARFRLVNGSLSLENQSFSSVSSLGENFAFKMEGGLLGASVLSLHQKHWLLKSPFWLPSEWDGVLHRRAGGLFMNQGYPMGLDETVEFEMPVTAGKVTTPPTRENKQEPLSWQIEWKQKGSILTARLQAELNSGELSAKDARLLQNQLRELLTAIAAAAECEMR